MDAFIPIVGITGTVLTADAAWLTYTMKANEKLFESIQTTPLTVRIVPAVLVYILIIAAVYGFAVAESKTMKTAVLRGAAIGLAMYGLYDLTNYATLTKYTLTMTVTDMMWGTALCAAGAAAGFYLKPK
jgi:uncharacterized membrane protein